MFSITQCAQVFVLGLFPQIRFLHDQVNSEQLKCVKLNSFISFVGAECLEIKQSVNLGK